MHRFPLFSPLTLRTPLTLSIIRRFIHPPIQSPNPNHNFPSPEFTTLCSLLTNPNFSPGPDLESALDRTGIDPTSPLVEAVFDRLDSSPKPLWSLFNWVRKKPGFEPSKGVVNSVVNVLAKAREFELAWGVVREYSDKGGDGLGLGLVSVESFVVLIRRYARAGRGADAIRTFEFAEKFEVWMELFEVLLDALCKEGHVGFAAEYLDRRMELESGWVPSVRVYNILLNGWFRAKKTRSAERLWSRMKKDNVVPTVVTYGTLVEGYCRLGRVERAIELVGEMRAEGIEANAVVYNPIVDALAEEGKFKEAMGMIEKLSVLESGSTLSTYNSLVKGLCKFGDIIEASKVLKVMINRGFAPTATTYNYFFRYLSKHGNIEEAMGLYSKMIGSGYDPDRLTFHLLIKMLCEREKLDFAVQVSKEMKARGCDMDLAASTMLIHLFCKMRRLDEAFAEIEGMIRRGIVPQFLTYQRIIEELRKRGLRDLVRKLHDMMASLPHSTKLPKTYKGGDNPSFLRRKSIMNKAKEMSSILRTCNNPRVLVKRRSFSRKQLPVQIN